MMFRSVINRYGGWILLAILVRLILMPWFGHEDILLTYQRATDMVFAGRSLLAVTSVVPHGIQALWLWLLSPLLGKEVLLSVHNDMIDMAQINLLLFVYKIPYLLAEIGFWFLFIGWLKPRKQIVLLMLFNPVVLYSVYVFGRYESFVMLFEALILIGLLGKRVAMTIASYLLLILTRFSLILILPAFLLLKVNWQKHWKLLTGLLLAIGLLIWYQWELISSQLKAIFNTPHFQFLFAAKLDLSFEVVIYLAVLGLVVLLVYLYDILKLKGINDSIVVTFSVVSVMMLFTYYSLALFHPQYFVWVLPMLYVVVDRFWKERILWQLTWMFMIVYFLLLLAWGSPTTLGLLTPIYSSFYGLDPQVLLGSLDLKFAASLGKTILSGLMIYFMIALMRVYRAENNPNP